MKLSSELKSLVCDYSIVCTTMFILFLNSCISALFYKVVLLYVAICSVYEYYIEEKNILEWIELGCVYVHPLIHINMMYNAQMFVTNIWLDLCLHFLTSVLSLYRGWNNKYARYYLMVISLGTFVTLLPTFDLSTIADRSSWNYIFATISVCNFSILNIFREKRLFGKRMIIEYFFTLSLYLLLIYNILPVYIFQASRYSETFFVACFLSANRLFHH